MAVGPLGSLAQLAPLKPQWHVKILQRPSTPPVVLQDRLVLALALHIAVLQVLFSLPSPISATGLKLPLNAKFLPNIKT
jgi:hypothetical protein